MSHCAYSYVLLAMNIVPCDIILQLLSCLCIQDKPCDLMILSYAHCLLLHYSTALIVMNIKYAYQQIFLNQHIKYYTNKDYK